jgi:hypothetical protein
MKTMAKTRKGQSRRRRGTAWLLRNGRCADRIMLEGDCPDIAYLRLYGMIRKKPARTKSGDRNQHCGRIMLHQTIKGQLIQSEELRPSRGIAKIGCKGLFQQGPGA